MALHDMLTPPEWKVYELIWEGKKFKEIGIILSYSPYTIDGFAQHIYSKLGVNSRAEATHYADVNGLFLEILESQAVRERQVENSVYTLKGGK